MKQSYLVRLLQLTWGLFLCALGTVMVINAKVGYTPWEVFHVGASKTFGISIGSASILTGAAVVFFAILLKEKLGLGTILNMVLVGLFLDMIMALNVIPVLDNFVLGISMLLLGLIVIAVGSYHYMKAGLGTGPRDSLMVAFTRRTGLPIGVCRGAIEFLAVILGWQLGGMVGVGTIVAAFTIGFWVQTIFKLFKFDATKIKHESIIYTIKLLFKGNK